MRPGASRLDRPAALVGMEVGRVDAVGFAPIKGTRHLTLDAVQVGHAGVVGDRRWCFVDVGGREVLRTVRHPALMALRAGVRATAGGTALRLAAPGLGAIDAVLEPSGETVTCDYWGRAVPLAVQDGPHAALASAWLGREVRLAEAPAGEVVYGGAVSLVGAASVAALPGDPGPARFRANVVVGGLGARAEDAWVGAEVHLGEVVVRPASPTPRCAVVDADPATGERDLPLLDALTRAAGAARSAGPVLGVDGCVEVPGTVRVGDPVRVWRPQEAGALA